MNRKLMTEIISYSDSHQYILKISYLITYDIYNNELYTIIITEIKILQPSSTALFVRIEFVLDQFPNLEFLFLRKIKKIWIALYILQNINIKGYKRNYCTSTNQPKIKIDIIFHFYFDRILIYCLQYQRDEVMNE